MKKTLIILLGVILIISGCFGGRLSYEEHLEKSIEKYYIENQPHNNGTLIIEQIRELENKYLVMCEKYSGDGHGFDDLFLMDNNFNITHVAHGYKPLSPCFSYNELSYNGKTILFGSFNDTKWIPENDMKVHVDIKEVYVEPKNKTGVFEKVNPDNGYLIVLEGEPEINKFELYNDNNEIQAELDDTIAICDDMKFVELKSDNR